ncbi:MAG: hypothetical protein MK116_01235 [Phycisphaerales bacterium]|nr:hypothetical protein [Phycisphaerales bacterium]
MPIQARDLFRHSILLPVLVVAGTLGSGWLQYTHAADTDRSRIAIRHLKKAVTPQRDDSHLARLASLRSMRDASLERLFLRLLQHESWRIQVHAVLGLAELSDDGMVMPWLVTQVQPDARNQILAIAMDNNQLGTKEARDLVDWKDLEEANRLALLAYLRDLGEPVKPGDVQSMTESENEKVASAAWLILTWLGDPKAVQQIDTAIEELPETRQFDILLTMTMMIRRYEILEAAEWLNTTVAQLDEERTFPEVVVAGTDTLLSLDPDRGLERWRALFGENATRRRQIEAVLMLMHAGVALPQEDRSWIDTDDELIGAIVEANNAVADGRADAPQQLIELADLNHIRSMGLLPDAIERLPDEQARVVWTHFLQRLESDSYTEMDRVLAIEATERLLDLEPMFLLQQLQEATDDSPLQEALLAGLLRNRIDGSEETVENIRRIGLSRPDALALLLLARDRDTLDEADIRNLGYLASGGTLSDQFQAQAAWLYLKHMDKVEDAMSQLVPEQQ